jgi:hypothetical protein
MHKQHQKFHVRSDSLTGGHAYYHITIRGDLHAVALRCDSRADLRLFDLRLFTHGYVDTRSYMILSVYYSKREFVEEQYMCLRTRKAV